MSRKPCALSTSGAVLGATMYSTALYALMIFDRDGKTSKKVMRNDMIFLPLSLIYGFYLARSWESDTLGLLLPGSLTDGFSKGFSPMFFPSLDGIVTIFSRSLDSVASLVLHILGVNLMVGRYIFLNSFQHRLLDTSLLVLSMTCTPVALVLFFLFKFLYSREERNRIHAKKGLD